MTIFPEYRMRCDLCGCISWISDVNARQVWKQAKGTGWKRKLGNDVCPSCAGTNDDYWDVGF
jgi:hypothetical protein